jgi:hypothetical protein
LVESLCEVADGEAVSEMSTLFVPLSVAFTSSVPVGVGLIRGSIGGELICGDVFEVSVICRP